MQNPEKSPFKQIDFYRTTKINKFMDGLTQNRKNKIQEIIQGQLDRIKFALEKQIQRNQTNKHLQQKNLLDRNQLKLKIYEKIMQAEQKKEQHIKKIRKIQKQKIEHVKKINKKKKEMEGQKFRQQIKLKNQINRQLGKQFIKRQKKLNDYYRSVEQLKTQYEDAVKKKNTIYDSSIRFASASKQQFKNRIEKGQQNLRSILRRRMSQFLTHNIQLKDNYQKANAIQKNKNDKLIDNIVNQFKISDTVLEKNDKQYQKQAKLKKQNQKQKKQKLIQNKLQLRSTFAQKIKSCICLARSKQNQIIDNNSDGDLSPERRDRVLTLSKTMRSSMYDTKSSNFLPLVKQHKNMLQKQQKQKQQKIVDKHNQMRKLLQSKKLVLTKSSSLKRQVLFTKNGDELMEIN